MTNKYFILALLCCVLVCAVYFAIYERRRTSAAEAVLVAAMVAFASLGRLVFAAMPHFKPVTAIIIVAGASLGAGPGFVTGALTAAVSNMYYGQGPWTPFQMAVWGIIGLLAGLFGKRIRKSRLKLVLFGALCGVLYSLLMDLCTVIMANNGFSLARYGAYAAASLPVMAVYSVSNAVFLYALGKRMCRRLIRIKIKYID